VFDVDRERAAGVAARLGVPAFPSADSLCRAADALVVAVPTVDHHAVARAALETGLDVLLEKPISATLEQAESLVDIVERSGRVLHVGHLEWHNAALRVVRDRVRSPRFVEVHRVGPFAPRGTDVDVVRDLMIHDLDILQQLLGEEPERIDAVGVPVLTDQIDIANARIRFPSGCVADLTASRVAALPKRRMRFFQLDGCVSVDFLAPSATVVRRASRGGNGAPRIETEELSLVPEDALLAQLRAFAQAVAKRDALAESARSALGALRTALRVVAAMPVQEELA
jgi:predicted dehydrogenase